MTLSKEAVAALVDLEHGATMNCMHTIARELIAEGYAFDGWGQLEITEMGRRAARTYRSFVAEGMADLGGGTGDFSTPANSHGVPDPDFEILPVGPDAKVAVPDAKVIAADVTVVDPDAKVTGPIIPWSRSRAMQAAGVANGCVGAWVEETWVLAFMDAYEQI